MLSECKLIERVKHNTLGWFGHVGRMHDGELLKNVYYIFILPFPLPPLGCSYFHQVAPLLDADDTIFCVNAFNYNSFTPFALDTSRLYRDGILPAYGWMVNRRWAMEVIPKWPKTNYVSVWIIRSFTIEFSGYLL